MTQLDEMIKLDLGKIFLRHATLWLNEVVNFMEQYPEVEGVNFGTKSIKFQGAELHESHSYEVRKPVPYTSSCPEMHYYLTCTTKEGVLIKLIDLYPCVKELSNTLELLKKNASSTLSSVLVINKKNQDKSIKDMFGENFLNFYKASAEHEKISDAIDSPAQKDKKTLKV